MITIDLPKEIRDLWQGLAIGYFQERFIKEFGFKPRGESATVGGYGDKWQWMTNEKIEYQKVRDFILNPDNYKEPEGDCLQWKTRRGVIEDLMNIEFPNHTITYIQAAPTQRIYFTPKLTDEEKKKARDLWREHIDFI